MRTRPTPDIIRNPVKLLALLNEAYEDIAELRAARLPGTVPGLKAITANTHAELRKHVGDDNGELGPRVCLVAGRASALDGGEGAFVWDSRSTLTDDDTNTIQPMGVKVGRWRKGSF